MDKKEKKNDIINIETDKMDLFKKLMNNIISEALIENNNRIANEISESVSYEVSKELNYLIRRHESNEEERYRKFDTTLREYQKQRMMTAISNEGSRPRKKSSKFFKKNNVYI